MRTVGGISTPVVIPTIVQVIVRPRTCCALVFTTDPTFGAREGDDSQANALDFDIIHESIGVPVTWTCFRR